MGELASRKIYYYPLVLAFRHFPIGKPHYRWSGFATCQTIAPIKKNIRNADPPEHSRQRKDRNQMNFGS